MANQAIALQARAPQQGNFLAPAIQQAGQIANRMAQQQALDRQTATAEQALKVSQASEARAAAKAPFELAEATEKALTAQQKNTLGFYDLVAAGVKNSSTPEQVLVIANFLKETYPGATKQIDQKLSDMPSDLAAFDAWREKTMRTSLDAKDQLTNEYITQNTGAEQRVVAVSKYGGGPATEVPGSRFQSAQDITYVRGEDGSVRAMPKDMPGTGGFGAPAPAAPAAGLVGGARGGALGPSIEQFAQQLSPGVIVSGRARTPERNAQVGGVPGSYHLTDNARDLQPGKGQTLAGLYNSLAPLKAQGFDVIKERNHVHVEPSPGKAPAPRGGAGGLQFGQVVPGMQGSGKKDGKTTEAERRFGTISKQMRSNLEEAANILTSSPEVIKPSGTEYAAKQIPFYGEEASMFAQSEARQQFVPAVLRFLDNVTFVNTGAGVTTEQKKDYMRSYVPTYQDTPASAHRKLVNMIVFAKNVKDAAGSQWTPDMDASFKTLEQAVAKLKPTAKPAATGRKTPTGVDTNNPLLKG
jgi:hypothetical protein